jgi:Spy/CpxP family protein refolding chaperone
MSQATEHKPQPRRTLGTWIATTAAAAALAALAQPALAMPGGMGGMMEGPMGGGGHPAHMRGGAGGEMHGGMGGGMGLPLGHPRMAQRLLDSVNATPEQRTQVSSLLEAARTDLQAQREAGRTLREQQRALFAQPTVDARAAETLRQQMLAQHDAGSKRMTQLMLDVSRVLTPAQRQQLAERSAQRREMMQRHQRERRQQHEHGQGRPQS